MPSKPTNAKEAIVMAIVISIRVKPRKAPLERRREAGFMMDGRAKASWDPASLGNANPC
jgi:hypothetical protein